MSDKQSNLTDKEMEDLQCVQNSNSRDNEPCCKCDGRTTNINKAKVDSLEIIAQMLDNKPYYELKYRQLGKKDYSIGYSSYDLKIVLDYIDTYFEIVKSDNHTNADRIRNMSDEELAEWLTNMCDFEKNEEPYKSIYNLDTEKEECKEWCDQTCLNEDWYIGDYFWEAECTGKYLHMRFEL
jgi:hypothetical protein|nr:MAG TPA: hypothetical protein [Caudoviricetes sp.]